MLPQWLVNAVVVMVAGLTGVNFSAQFLLDAWTPDPYIYGLSMAVLPVVLGLRRGVVAAAGKEQSE
jgi:hypothetical protein